MNTAFKRLVAGLTARHRQGHHALHCVIWPAMLMSRRGSMCRAGVRPRLRLLKGEKMSKSLGTHRRPAERRRSFGGRSAPACTWCGNSRTARTAISRWERFEERLQLGPRQQPRVICSAASPRWRRSYCGRTGCCWPAGPSGRPLRGGRRGVASYRTAMDAFALQDGMAPPSRSSTPRNLFIHRNEPWKLAKRRGQRSAGGADLYDVARRCAARHPCCCRLCRRRTAGFSAAVGAPKPRRRAPARCKRPGGSGQGN